MSASWVPEFNDRPFFATAASNRSLRKLLVESWSKGGAAEAVVQQKLKNRKESEQELKKKSDSLEILSLDFAQVQYQRTLGNNPKKILSVSSKPFKGCKLSITVWRPTSSGSRRRGDAPSGDARGMKRSQTSTVITDLTVFVDKYWAENTYGDALPVELMAIPLKSFNGHEAEGFVEAYISATDAVITAARITLPYESPIDDALMKKKQLRWHLKEVGIKDSLPSLVALEKDGMITKAPKRSAKYFEHLHRGNEQTQYEVVSVMSFVQVQRKR
ncbi:uncharacterized protein BT62DRAFT_994982 [Guyanagaster necrorhizus]|uniref:Uncharacterized protein n=1 Tax=Guyanagaster necrorhizus TaxID=856835 RepID=A0A9P7VQD2_9AGAR|nr:uncharacterized protein BT62DRAFT_994982 [Guyanagaster necrorhizus MCA 3950]KAG7444969.1 hypothetical protein BT62DRAFT_994982 [Guyanagaster necrorhizus MCA 3950]